jgi:endoplasmic reticulum protein 29
MAALVLTLADYGDKLNDDLRERFGLNKDDFPVFKIFKKGTSDPVAYTGEIKSDALLRFTKDETGTLARKCGFMLL